MTSVQITWGGEALILFGERAVFWARANTLLIADVHLGKASAFRQAGIPVPEQVTDTDLRRVSELLRGTGAARLIILGDLFHARSGQTEATLSAFASWREQHAKIEIELLLGNHDRHIGHFPETWNIQTRNHLDFPPFLLGHETAESRHYGIFGHVHPAVRCAGMRLPCFYFGARTALLPAFGSFTGSHVIRPEPEARIFLINAGEIAELPRSRRKQ